MVQFGGGSDLVTLSNVILITSLLFHYVIAGGKRYEPGEIDGNKIKEISLKFYYEVDSRKNNTRKKEISYSMWIDRTYFKIEQLRTERIYGGSDFEIFLFQKEIFLKLCKELVVISTVNFIEKIELTHAKYFKGSSCIKIVPAIDLTSKMLKYLTKKRQLIILSNPKYQKVKIVFND